MRGKGVATRILAEGYRDHPRLCGEKVPSRCKMTHSFGSPPPMRGKAYHGKTYSSTLGITPAYAGKSLPLVLQWSSCPDHPRLCGEKDSMSQPKSMNLGSPPPMRGKAVTVKSLCTALRITPAYAGKSKAVIDVLGFFGDHPRLCGEKYFFILFSSDFLGSPPPMRGKEGVFCPMAFDDGITPAYAGKSSACYKHCHCDGDHPRLCGEKSYVTYSPLLSLGSPPPMRGKGFFYATFVPNVRITPAYAGKRWACMTSFGML